MARNAWYGVALLALTAVAACGGAGDDDAKAAAATQAQLAASRARTDSLRKVRAAKLAAAAVRTDSAAGSTADSASGGDSTARASLAATAGPSAPADSLMHDGEAALADSVQRAKEIEVMRETFAYAGGTRDPFSSLINLDGAGPEISDLDLVGVYLDLRTPTNNVIVLREKGTTGKRHKMRVGDQLGRSRLTQIRARDAVFMIQDFGFERQETLSLRKQEVETP